MPLVKLKIERFDLPLGNHFVSLKDSERNLKIVRKESALRIDLRNSPFQSTALRWRRMLVT
jgi:hypothetical protein